MKRFTVAVVCLSGCIVGPACQSIVGIEDRVEAAADDAGATSDGGPSGDDASIADAGCKSTDTTCRDPDAAPSLKCPQDCLPPAPTGWSGPSALFDGAESAKPASCPAAYPTKVVESHKDVNAAQATCDCGGPVVSGRFCKAAVHTYPIACDKFASDIGTVTTTQCLVGPANDDYSFKVDPPVLVPGTCNYPNAKTTLPPVSFAKVEVACALAQTTACATRPDCVATPAPDQPFGHVCIHKDGELACPSDDYPVRIIAYQKVDDTRGCTACTSTPSGGACGTNWGTRAKVADCSNVNAPTDKVAGGCYQYPIPGAVIDIAAMAPTDGTCTPSGGAPSGVASSVQPVTYCCNQ